MKRNFKIRSEIQCYIEHIVPPENEKSTLYINIDDSENIRLSIEDAGTEANFQLNKEEINKIFAWLKQKNFLK